ncbi:hypothetical protein [Marivivens sp. JLT3646]|uniref:hypothetical protein n=1 Tax=Marivivens sp. JLT3646 TaxID=1920883 RepID=UPI000801F81F|nr:hypothetical protein [Marivivens sp. JLT3646]APO88189.1 hypothetical protein BSK21_14895 [Marivivens sp. JLT3646]OBR35480.1 hypothetical protein A9199_10560 [Donghicola sp. JL3646]
MTIEPHYIHQQHYTHFGRLNDLIYKLPILYSGLFGGLWYFAFSQKDANPWVAALVLFFCSILSFIFKKITGRLGRAMSGYIDNINKMDGEFAVTLKNNDGKNEWSTINWINFALTISGLGSIVFIIIVLFPQIQQIVEIYLCHEK